MVLRRDFQKALLSRKIGQLNSDSVIFPPFLSASSVYSINSANIWRCAAINGASGTAVRSRPGEYKMVIPKAEISPGVKGRPCL